MLGVGCWQVDKNALDSQVREKEEKKKKEESEKLYYDQLTASHAKLLSEVERERQRVRAAKEEELAFYRKQQELAFKKKKAEERTQLLAKAPPHHPLEVRLCCVVLCCVVLCCVVVALRCAARSTH